MTLESRRGRIVPPDLDDRTWQDLVDEMRALIPKYAPQWTDQNPSDLGITLIELFAWLGEAIIYRLNQTPEKNYLTFLNLLGITRDPAAPARTFLTFDAQAAVHVPRGVQAQTAAPPGGRPVTFETDEDLDVVPSTLRAALTIGPDGTATYLDATPVLVGPPGGTFPIEIPAGQTLQLCLGLDRAVTEVPLGIRLYQTVLDGGATIACTYSKDALQPLQWPPVASLGDGTEQLRHDGTLRISVPADWTAQRAAGPATGPVAQRPWTAIVPASGGPLEPLFWLGLQVTAPAAPAGQPLLSAGIDRLLFNAVSARTALTIRNPEALGTSTGQPFQVFALRNQPLYRRTGLSGPYADLVVQVEEGTPPAWTDWSLAEDLPAGAGRYYRLDPVAGEIRFGNFDERRGTGSGSIPPAGAGIQAVSYRWVDRGAGGNVGPMQVLGPATTRAGAGLTGITVINRHGARDGADEEPIEDTLRRAPDELRIRYRAVTVEDYEFLAREASNDLVIRRCLPPRLHTDTPAGANPPWRAGDPWEYGGVVRAPGTVNLIVVPDRAVDVPRPQPTPDQLRVVQAYLDARRDLTTRLEVIAPRYLPVVVNVEIVVWQQAINAGADRASIEQDTRARIQRFLHPTRGGPDGTGWQVGDPVFTSDLFTALMPAEDVGYISMLAVRPDIPDYHFPPQGPGGAYKAEIERPFGLSPLGASVRLADYELVCAAPDPAHTVTTTSVQD